MITFPMRRQPNHKQTNPVNMDLYLSCQNVCNTLTYSILWYEFVLCFSNIFPHHCFGEHKHLVILFLSKYNLLSIFFLHCAGHNSFLLTRVIYFFYYNVDYIYTSNKLHCIQAWRYCLLNNSHEKNTPEHNQTSGITLCNKVLLGGVLWGCAITIIINWLITSAQSWKSLLPAYSSKQFIIYDLRACPTWWVTNKAVVQCQNLTLWHHHCALSIHLPELN